MSRKGQRIGLQTIIAIVIVGLFAGCASVFQDFDDKMSRNRFKEDFEALETALDVYDQGDITKALGLFKEIKAASTSAKVGRRAWLGEVCCCLMLAETPTEFTAAVGMWHDYAGATTDEDMIWSQALLDPLVVRQTPTPVTTVVEVPVPVVQPTVNTREPIAAQKQAHETRNASAPSPEEIEALKKKARRADKLQLEMAKILAENRSLKEKIKALEAIDQNIQKKKTEISTSGE